MRALIRRSLLAVAATIFWSVSANAMDDEEPNHPIPNLGVIDVHVVWKTGGSDLNIVIASPLKADAHSEDRLGRKIENYLGEIRSSAYAERHGIPSLATTAIVVNLHPGSDKEIVEFLESYRSRIAAAGATLKIKVRDPATIKSYE